MRAGSRGRRIRRSRASDAIIDSRWHGMVDGREITIPCGGTHVSTLTELGQVQVTLASSEEDLPSPPGSLLNHPQPS